MGRWLRGAVDVRGMLLAAEQQGFPFLGGVDVYDDTTFNQKQSQFLANELAEVVDSSDNDLTDAAQSLSTALALVRDAPHRYVVFNGD